LEGDKVEIRDGKVYVNGEALEEDYINVDVEGTLEVNEITVNLCPEGHIYVLGIIDFRAKAKTAGPLGLLI